jgi:hypothetical protein
MVEEQQELDRRQQNLDEEIESLENDEEFDESQLADIPELPIAPVRPDSSPFSTLVERREVYFEERAEFLRLSALRDSIIAYNQFIRQSIEAESRAQRDEMIAEREQQIREIENERVRLFQEMEVASDDIDLMERRIGAFRNFLLTSVSSQLVDLTVGYSKQESRGMGKPKDVGTRGIASMRHNYGIFDSESEGSSESEESEDEDVLDFNDARNEMYYTRPVKK